ncbi:1-phosphofructokinase [Vagococcus silagei]|uniref:Tagatose-6-phosphate kinase n=1 Tax=Vagococcus silagei TaxID=2508885 RepID=A0A4S3B837_9ENTE|nr:1-phosphofructokinase [Vagococcus silagei]THB61005.1 1-phosphofructokinase [Vagococcus silagei]
MIYTVTLNPAVDYVVFVPEFQSGDLNKATRDYKFPGGKGINVSRVLKNLGTSSINLGFVGGFTGEFIQEKLLQEKLKTNFVPIKAENRINVKLKSNQETEINGQGPLIEQDELAHFMSQLSNLTLEDLVVFSGSIPQGVPKNIYQMCLEMLEKNHVPFVLDISSSELLELVAYHPELIKPNHHELAEIFQTSFSNLEEMLPYGEKLVTMGAKNVLVSMGKEGAVLFNQEGTYLAPGMTGELINSVGSGDSMVAGFIQSYWTNHDSVSALKLGVAAGSATAFTEDLASGEEILNILDRVVVHKLS